MSKLKKTNLDSYYKACIELGDEFVKKYFNCNYYWIAQEADGDIIISEYGARSTSTVFFVNQDIPILIKALQKIIK